ncbi:MAG: hypothetical protein PUC60_04160 [Clostridiales bacterium]|nr:hypothetical protein [Clostridiales bacterium]
MKKKIWLPIIAAVVLLAVLFVPIPSGTYKDGGTREYAALTYKIVDWNKLTSDGKYDKTKIYFFPNNFKSINELWTYEEDEVEYQFNATILELSDTTALVEPLEDEDERRSSDKISFGLKGLDDIEAKVGSVVEVTYAGGMMESYPAQIKAVSWKLSDNLRHLEFTEQWLDKAAAAKYENDIFSDIIITRIYANCFFAEPVIPGPYEIKLNGTLSDEWCVGDQVICTYENTYCDEENNRVEADMLTIRESTFEMEPGECYKPVIYLYPEEETDISVNLILDGRLTCTYPAYNDGWTVTASPDGTLTDAKGRTYNYLYWEGETYARYDLSKGFCVKGEDTAVFLEDALEKLGLTRREANEFIVYWLPQMQDNPYNIISFQTGIYTNAAKLAVNPAPDTLIRVFMAWQASDTPVVLENQELSAPDRTGFTVVEWGGAEMK